jgi:hypothetical protein
VESLELLRLEPSGDIIFEGGIGIGEDLLRTGTDAAIGLSVLGPLVTTQFSDAEAMASSIRFQASSSSGSETSIARGSTS